VRHHLRFGGAELPEYMRGSLSHHAGQSPVQPDLHHPAARVQAAVLAPSLNRASFFGSGGDFFR
jgi:hypothetical protein